MVSNDINLVSLPVVFVCRERWTPVGWRFIFFFSVWQPFTFYACNPNVHCHWPTSLSVQSATEILFSLVLCFDFVTNEEDTKWYNLNVVAFSQEKFVHVGQTLSPQPLQLLLVLRESETTNRVVINYFFMFPAEKSLLISIMSPIIIIIILKHSNRFILPPSPRIWIFLPRYSSSTSQIDVEEEDEEGIRSEGSLTQHIFPEYTLFTISPSSVSHETMGRQEPFIQESIIKHKYLSSFLHTLGITEQRVRHEMFLPLPASGWTNGRGLCIYGGVL